MKKTSSGSWLGILGLVGIIIILISVFSGGHSSESASVSRSSSGTRYIDCTMCHTSGKCYHCKGERFINGRTCSVCDGTGNCSRCEGNKRFEVFNVEGKDCIECGSCHGSRVCNSCNGSGTYSVSFSTLGSHTGNCSTCGGKKYCLACKGKGYIEV